MIGRKKRGKKQEESQIVRYRYGEANVKIYCPPQPLLPLHFQHFIGLLAVPQFTYVNQGPCWAFGQNLTNHLFLTINLCWSTAMPICLHIIYGYLDWVVAIETPSPRPDHTKPEILSCTWQEFSGPRSRAFGIYGQEAGMTPQDGEKNTLFVPFWV